MEKRWNLDQLYLSFQDENFLKDIETLKEMLEDMKKYPQKQKSENDLKDYLKEANAFEDLVEKIYAFISLTMSSDTTSQDALKYSSIIETLLAGFADTQAKIHRWIGQFDLDNMHDDYILEIFEKKDRRAAGPTAPAYGLYQYAAYYNNDNIAGLKGIPEKYRI